MTSNLQYNERESTLKNMGEDVDGSHRHRYIDSATMEKKKADKALIIFKAAQKLAFDNVKASNPKSGLLLATVIREGLLAEYCFKKQVSFDSLLALKTSLIADKAKTSKDVNDFNLLVRNSHKVSRLSVTELVNYYETKKRPEALKGFYESNGQAWPWKDLENCTDLDESKNYLLTQIKAVQFGKTVTDNERALLLKNLSHSLGIFKSVLNIDLTDLTFCFGSRGKSTSVAFYDDSRKVISINRGNIGSIVHELGHYIDYKLGKVSYRIPSETVAAYRLQIQGLNLSYAYRQYYLKPTELFARLFEVYCQDENTLFFQTVRIGGQFMPVLSDECRQWLNDILTKLTN